MDNRSIFEAIIAAMNSNLNVLADVKADMLYKQHFKKPIDEAAAAKFMLCYNQLPLCDQLKVDRQANQIAARRILDKKKSETSDKYSKIALVFIGVLWLIGVITCLSYIDEYGDLARVLLGLLIAFAFLVIFIFFAAHIG